MEYPRGPLRGRVKAATLLESVLALALLAGALSFGVYMHFRVMSSARSGDRCEAWSMSEQVAEEVMRTGAFSGTPSDKEGWRIDVAQRANTASLEQWTITCTKGTRVLLVRELLAPTP
jgi:hypothetical protein